MTNTAEKLEKTNELMLQGLFETLFSSDASKKIFELIMANAQKYLFTYALFAYIIKFGFVLYKYVKSRNKNLNEKTELGFSGLQAGAIITAIIGAIFLSSVFATITPVIFVSAMAADTLRNIGLLAWNLFQFAALRFKLRKALKDPADLLTRAKYEALKSKYVDAILQHSLGTIICLLTTAAVVGIFLEPHIAALTFLGGAVIGKLTIAGIFGISAAIATLVPTVVSLVGKIISFIRREDKCDLLLMSSPPEKNTLEKLKIKSKVAYVRSEQQLYYLNKATKECTLLNLTPKQLASFDFKMKVKILSVGNYRTLTDQELRDITLSTGHARENKLQPENKNTENTGSQEEAASSQQEQTEASDHLDAALEFSPPPPPPSQEKEPLVATTAFSKAVELTIFKITNQDKLDAAKAHTLPFDPRGKKSEFREIIIGAIDNEALAKDALIKFANEKITKLQAQIKAAKQPSKPITFFKQKREKYQEATRQQKIDALDKLVKLINKTEFIYNDSGDIVTTMEGFEKHIKCTYPEVYNSFFREESDTYNVIKAAFAYEEKFEVDLTPKPPAAAVATL